MKEEELRIGNLLYHNDEHNYAGYKGVFRWTEIDWYKLGECGIYLENISPIKLTEEILLKCGFEIIRFKAPAQSVGNDLYYGYDLAILRLGVKTELIIRFKNNKFKIDGFYNSDIKFLHQLQNLYYSLTNQELEVKL